MLRPLSIQGAASIGAISTTVKQVNNADLNIMSSTTDVSVVTGTNGVVVEDRDVLIISNDRILANLYSSGVAMSSEKITPHTSHSLKLQVSKALTYDDVTVTNTTRYVLS